MTDNSNVSGSAAARPKLGIRAGVSRKLLERKAAERAGEEVVPGEAVEECFPAAAKVAEAASNSVAHAVQPAAGAPATDAPPAAQEALYNAAAVVPGHVPPAPASATQEAATAPAEQPAAESLPAPQAPAPAWSADDERALTALLARRKAAGFQRRGRDVGEQTIRLGSIAPNPGTVVAVIVGLVAERGGSVGRADLITAMASAAFPHPRAQPSDRGWCQGYVAGAVRNGFLALADAGAASADSTPAAQPALAA